MTPLNLCRTCRQDFTSTRLFDLHRVGKHAYTFTEGARTGQYDGRRCLDEEEMRGKGWELDSQGRWVDPARAADARERLSAVTGSASAVSGVAGRTAETPRRDAA